VMGCFVESKLVFGGWIGLVFTTSEGLIDYGRFCDMIGCIICHLVSMVRKRSKNPVEMLAVFRSSSSFLEL